MKYLSDRITFKFTLSSPLPDSGICKYELYGYDAGTQEEPEYLIFVGNLYYNGEYNYTVDVTDIVRSVKTTTSIGYFTNGNYYNGLDTTLTCRFKVKVYFSNGTLDSGWKTVAMCYRYPNYKNTNNFSNGDGVYFDNFTTDEGVNTALQGIYSGKSALIPHYPLIPTNKYSFAQSFLCGYSEQIIPLSLSRTNYYRQQDYQTAQSQEGTSIIYPLENFIDWQGLTGSGDLDVEDYNEQVIAIFDECPKRYYLFWQDRFGGYQSQAFNDYTSYSETFDTEEVQNYRNEHKKSTIQIQPKWKINSGWIKEDVYSLYESIFVSPVLFLYDSHEDRLHEVIVNGDYTEKTYKEEKKLLNLTLELESISKQQIIY